MLVKRTPFGMQKDSFWDAKGLLLQNVSNFLQPPHQNIPHRNDVTYRTGEHKEVEYGVHIPLLAQAVEGGTCDISHTLGYNPYYCRRTHTVHQRTERYKHTQSHHNVACRFYVSVALQSDETLYKSGDWRQPYKDE